MSMAIPSHIAPALEKTGGKVEGPQGAARALEINLSTPRKKMKKLGIPFGRKIRKVNVALPEWRFVRLENKGGNYLIGLGPV